MESQITIVYLIGVFFRMGEGGQVVHPALYRFHRLSRAVFLPFTPLIDFLSVAAAARYRGTGDGCGRL